MNKKMLRIALSNSPASWRGGFRKFICYIQSLENSAKIYRNSNSKLNYKLDTERKGIVR